MKRYVDYLFEEVKVEEDIVFAEVIGFDGKTAQLALDVYQPAKDEEKNRRCLFIVHGGGFVLGNDKQQDYIVTLANIFAKLGYVCISPDYRLYERSQRPDRLTAAQRAAEDVELARQFILANYERYGIDPFNIAIMGGSAGGMTAHVACKQPNAYKALVSLWGAPKECIQPEHYIDTLLIHGTEDKLVDYKQSENVLAELLKHNIHCELIRLEGAGHTAIDRKDEFLPRTISFLEDKMRKHHG